MKWSPGASEGVVVAGGNGRGSESNQLNNPIAIDLDSNGKLYIADQVNHRIQRYGSAYRIKIPAGSTTGIMTVTGIADDLIDEENETIIVTPSGITNGILTSSDATTLTITNPVANAQSVTVDEQTDFTITLTGADSENDILSFIVLTIPATLQWGLSSK